ncbi:hypothetical protein WQ57_22750 [Mesobacillus campisalis]|uniref:DinB-like domain-containing protein n=1 Tax=Mesobacillus campisalis TaxID=1408103 RepID=A0A0M2SL43_9BACI|nr:DinB family protein [Mesobacillus campisalis]KKK34376.1 hypothetical protein WQ57_22750 [Mesobacillus campisalis]
MNKEEMKRHYIEFIFWAEQMGSVQEEEWRSPIEEGKWSVAAVVTHLLFWDKFSLKERLPYFKEGASLPAYPDFQEVNDAARAHAVKHEKNDMIEELIRVRRQYLDMLDSLTQADLDIRFAIGNNSMTVRDYFMDFIKHDRHHQTQIDKILRR